MGKVNKRQRKFLSKAVLPHKKKGGRRVDNKKKGGAAGTEANTRTLATPQQRRTLPDGLDTTSFLECPWLTKQACATAECDTCVAPFDPEKSLLGVQAKSKNEDNTKRTISDGGGGKGVVGLTEKMARTMINRAVDEASVDELLRAVWALSTSQTATLDGSTSAGNSSLVSPPLELRADPDSKAMEVLRQEGFGRLHLAFRAHLGPERQEGDSKEEWNEAVRTHRQLLEKAGPWPIMGSALLYFLTAALDHLEVAAAALAAATSATSTTPSLPSVNSNSSASGGGSSGGGGGGGGKDGREPSPSRSKEGPAAGFLIEALARMRDHTPLMFPFPRLARRYLVFLLGLLETAEDNAVLSLAFVRLYELSTSQPMPFLHDAFKGAYRCYRGAAERIGGGGRGGGVLGRAGVGGAGSLPFLRECFAELFGVEKPSAYLVSPTPFAAYKF